MQHAVEPGFEMCFDFDHIDPTTKRATVSQLVTKKISQKTLEDEIAKCRLLCCYCHKDRTAKQLGYHYADSLESGEQ